ncbi:MAG: putative membrane protein [Paraglaciecola sp.]|jgi:uncharacterized membrane protein
MPKIKDFFITTFIGGLVVLLPIAILYKLFEWFLSVVSAFISPITDLVVKTLHTDLFISEIVAALGVLFCCFLIGLIIRTAWGEWLHNALEKIFFANIPGYRSIRDLLSQLNSKGKNSFSQPVLYSFDNNDNYLIGFITDSYQEERIAVFIPTSPSPVNGFVIQTALSNVKKLDISTEAAMKIVIACGVGSSQMIAKLAQPDH